MVTVKREASCSCGKLWITAEGEPVKISVCHCRECQRRTGSAFGVAVYWMPEFRKDLVALALGCFDEPSSLVPMQSVYEESRLRWVGFDLPGGD